MWRNCRVDGWQPNVDAVSLIYCVEPTTKKAKKKEKLKSTKQ